MKPKTLIIALTLLILGLVSCQKPVPTDLATVPVIPKPMSVTATGDAFKLTRRTALVIPENDSIVATVALHLKRVLKKSTGFPLPLRYKPARGSIRFVLNSGLETGDEGYHLNITTRDILVEAKTPAGLYFGVQTLRQLLPAEVEDTIVHEGPWYIPTGEILDEPQYAYRGVMLDVARHFFTPDEVKRFIDLVSLYKINTLHLHLSDDQGWRIEIKSWPQLTETGGQTEVGGGPGGFYTQEEYKDLVRYAEDRFMTIVPEIDMPGHTNAALASYSELNCDGKARELYTGTNVGFSTLCTDKEVVYKFIDDVVGEISEMTPGPWFHIGGDESHVTPMEDYIPFVNRVQKIVASHGKQVIGWDEIAHATLQPNTTVQFWARSENALKGVEQGAKVLMSPANKTYLDMQYDSTTKYGLHWANYIEVDTAYMWDPAALVEGIGKEDILGVEAPIWSETVTNINEVEYMFFPRLPAVAEVAWTETGTRSWEDFRTRLAAHGKRLEILDVNFYRSPRIDW